VTFIPQNFDALLTRDQVAAALTTAGFPVKAKTLSTKATRGGGPPYRLFGRKPLYRWGDALAWAQGRCTEVGCSTSEHDTTSAPHPQRHDRLQGQSPLTVRLHDRA
jgi:hypothetical protein